MSKAPVRQLLCVVILFLVAVPRQNAQTQETIIIDAGAPSHPFPHYWEQMFGSGRAILSLRDSYRQDLRSVKEITDFKYVRFHAIFHDEVGVYDEDNGGNAIYNFSYVDQIYDGLLAQGMKPFVELSFMPYKLAAAQKIQAFWYKPNVSPPKDWGKWDALISAFVNHLVARYGIEEVATWYFEVWNEPNIDFWAGEPKQATYFELYDHTASDVKRVSQRLRVGGPATAQAAWIDAFIQHCVQRNVPVDFVSTHVYANDTSNDVFHTDETIPRDQMVCRAVRHVHNQIQASSRPQLPLIWSEFNASYKNEPAVTDSIYMGPWLAETIQQCDGLVDMMSYWTFSDVFEEQGVVKTPFYGGFGLLAEDSIPKPAYDVFALLHKLGDVRLSLNSTSALVTRRSDGALVLAVWNYAPVGLTVSTKKVALEFRNAHFMQAAIWRVDANHGDFHKVYATMQEAQYPTISQIQQLRDAARLGAPEHEELQNSELTLEIPSSGLIIIELK
jgi:xylan 1,4-beta-xylosidase